MKRLNKTNSSFFKTFFFRVWGLIADRRIFWPIDTELASSFANIRRRASVSSFGNLLPFCRLPDCVAGKSGTRPVELNQVGRLLVERVSVVEAVLPVVEAVPSIWRALN